MPLRSASAALLVMLVCDAVIIAAPDSRTCPPAANSVTAMGFRAEIAQEDRHFPAGAGSHAIRHESVDETRYVRVRLRARAPAGVAWQLVVREESGRAIDFLTAGDFADGQRWTSRVPGSLVRFDRYVDGTPDALQVEFLEYIAMPVKARRPYYSYQDRSHPKVHALYDARSPASLDERRLGDSVVYLTAAWDTTMWPCSGVIVAPTLLMTNWHCGGVYPLGPDEYWSDEICDSILVDASWDEDDRSREFMCARVAAVDRALDVAILEIKPIESVGAVRPAVLSSDPPRPGLASMVHHPEAQPKRISLLCPVIGVSIDGWQGTPAVRFTHQCDSEGGSSGSPIFDDAGKVVGLHHHGFAMNRDTCTPDDNLNKAVRMDAILRWLDSSDERRTLLKRMTVR
jgi:hypothetical protein